MATPRDIHVPWLDYKTIAASQSALGPTEKIAANTPTDAHQISERMRNMEVRISGEYADRTGTVYFYAARKDDDICLLGSATVTVGDQVSSEGHYYVHQMTLTDRWITEVKLVDAGGNDGMSRIVFDVSGYDIFFVLIDFTLGSPPNKWYIDVSGFGQ